MTAVFMNKYLFFSFSFTVVFVFVAAGVFARQPTHRARTCPNPANHFQVLSLDFFSLPFDWFTDQHVNCKEQPTNNTLPASRALLCQHSSSWLKYIATVL